MNENNMTALVSLFSRAYHSENNKATIFNDTVARKLLSDGEYSEISKSFANGIKFFNPNFKGTQEEALRWIVDNMLSPTVLARAAFCEKSLESAVKTGTRQYLILGAGYDSFAYRESEFSKELEIFELDREREQHDKLERLHRAGIEIKSNVHFIEADFENENFYNKLFECPDFNKEKISFCSLLGVLYYLKSSDFEKLLKTLSDILVKGSTLLFDYPNESSFSKDSGTRGEKQAVLAKGSNEEMKSCWSFGFMEHLLGEYNFLCYEHLAPSEITKEFFEDYNNKNPKHKMSAIENVNFCLAVKQ